MTRKITVIRSHTQTLLSLCNWSSNRIYKLAKYFSLS